jgi:hypothetical protein
MPYIKQEDRPKIDEVLYAMNKANIQANGDLNYLLFAYCKYNIPLSYNNIKNFCGELRQCATEIERRILGPYEDDKRRLNGDV